MSTEKLASYGKPFTQWQKQFNNDLRMGANQTLKIILKIYDENGNQYHGGERMR